MKKRSLFSYQTGRRMLILLGLTVFVFTYFALAITLLSGGLISAIQDSPALGGASVGLTLCCIILLCALVSPLIYLNGVKWMLPCLKNAFYEGICWLPGLHKLTPEYRQSPAYKQDQIKKLTKMQEKLIPKSNEWLELQKQKADHMQALQEIEENDRWLEQMARDKELADEANTKRRGSVSASLTRLADLEDGYYYDDEYYTGQESKPGCLQRVIGFILGGIFQLLLRLAKGLGYLLLAIALPVISPFLVFLLLGLVAPLLAGYPALMTAAAILLLIVFALLEIVYPILCLRLCPKPAPKKK